MGGYYSKFEEDKLVDVYYHGISRNDKEKNKTDENSKIFLEIMQKFGYYKIKFNQEKLLQFFKNNISILESFKNTNNKDIIETFITKDDDLKMIPMMIMIFSMYGIYVIKTDRDMKNSNIKKPLLIDDLEILLPKVYLIKEEYLNMINFIFEENLLVLITNPNEKSEILMFKKIVINIFNKIHQKINTKVVFSNILGLLIKIAVISSLFIVIERKNKKVRQPDGRYTSELSKSEKNRLTGIVINIITDEIINLIPDDKCNLLDKDIEFINIDPVLCNYNEISIYQANNNKLKIENKKLKDKIKELDSTINSTQNKLKQTTKSRDLWRIIAIAFILLFVIFLMLFIMKKCVEDKLDE